MPRLFIGLLSALAVATWIAAAEPAQIAIAPGSAARGSTLLEEKQCLRCHSFAGRGGSVAPDLAQRSVRAYTPALLASVMWNHSPAMWNAFDGAASRPGLSSTETADLFAHFYSLLYFSVPGDAARGRAVFESKNCSGCHSVEEPGSNLPGPPLSRWAEVKDPIQWAERMWNHSSRMMDEMARSGMKWPRLSTQNMVDLLVYIRNLPSARSQFASFRPGEPEQGRNVFGRNCVGCHSFGDNSVGKIDLLDRPAPRTLTDYVAAMWNHAPEMNRMQNDNPPVLAPGEMTHLISYLFDQHYFFEKGDVDRGSRLYRERNCIVCHETRRAQIGAPDLTQANERFSPVTMTSSIWRHGPVMLEMMQREQISWPEFHGAEMTDLIAFLNSRLVRRIAPGGPNDSLSIRRREVR